MIGAALTARRGTIWLIFCSPFRSVVAHLAHFSLAFWAHFGDNGTLISSRATPRDEAGSKLLESLASSAAKVSQKWIDTSFAPDYTSLSPSGTSTMGINSSAICQLLVVYVSMLTH